GLDVGIASIGWSVIKLRNDEKNAFAPDLLIDAGVRIFSAAEVPKTGESLNIKRRTARGLRRRLRRRKQRLKELKRLLIETNLLSDINTLTVLKNEDVSPWEIRVKALDTLITDLELSRAILH